MPSTPETLPSSRPGWARLVIRRSASTGPNHQDFARGHGDELRPVAGRRYAVAATGPGLSMDDDRTSPGSALPADSIRRARIVHADEQCRRHDLFWRTGSFARIFTIARTLRLDHGKTRIPA